MRKITKQDRKNAYLYCKFRDEQFALYDEYAKSNGMMQKEICERTFQSKKIVSNIVKNLLGDGFVTLIENEDDRRNKTVGLTDAGRAYAERPIRDITCSEGTAMSMFTPEEQEQLIALSRRFTKNLTELVKGSETEK